MEGGIASQQVKTCFVCDKPGHFAADCPNQYCQRCGQWGHGIRSCQRPSVAKFDPTDPKKAYSVPEETTVVDVLIEGKPWEAMIDSGASLSVICTDTLRELDLQHKMKPKPETLRAFDNTSIQSVEIVSLKLNMGKIEVIQRFTVVECKEARMTTVLRRDFQMKFQ